jgi:hypothetical protein
VELTCGSWTGWTSCKTADYTDEQVDFALTAASVALIFTPVGEAAAASLAARLVPAFSRAPIIGARSALFANGSVPVAGQYAADMSGLLNKGGLVSIGWSIMKVAPKTGVAVFRVSIKTFTKTKIKFDWLRGPKL